MDEQHYRRGQRGELIEHAPATCPNGHRLGADEVLVGNIPCMCPLSTYRRHRSWRCRRCDHQWTWPGCIERPDLPIWDGTTPPPRGKHR